MEPLLFVLILVGGFAAGVINTMAGGGSFITLPLLILSGLPATVANGTNRVAVVVQNVGALAGFRQRGISLGRSAWILLIPSVLGGILGALLAVDIDEALMRRVIGIALVVMLPLMLRSTRPVTGTGPVEPRLHWWTWPAYFAVGVYGGFLQAGVGFFYLALLVGLDGMSLVRANLVKVFLVLVYSVIALALFAMEGQVVLLPGLVLAAGNFAGGYAGAHLAVGRGERWIKGVLVVAVIISAAQLTGVTGWALGALR